MKTPVKTPVKAPVKFAVTLIVALTSTAPAFSNSTLVQRFDREKKQTPRNQAFAEAADKINLESLENSRLQEALHGRQIVIALGAFNEWTKQTPFIDALEVLKNEMGVPASSITIFKTHTLKTIDENSLELTALISKVARRTLS